MSGSRWGVTPRESIEAETARRGKASLVAGCIALLAGDYFADPPLVLALGGPGARKFFNGKPHDDDYWFRVWALRGLLWVWDDVAVGAVRRALDDPSWRVREMALKVVARHRLGDLLEAAATLRDDPDERVRTTAQRAVVTVARSES
jgi:hypothetical protein